MSRKIFVTSALPYANGPIHIGHLVEYIQTDIWVRFQKIRGNECMYFCADDTHGTAIMISARAENTSPEQLIERVHSEHKHDFERFLVSFDNYYTTHSPENKLFSELIFKRLSEAGSIAKRNVEQAYCPRCGFFLPDRYIRGACPRCEAADQYGDSCEACGGTHQGTELIGAVCANCGSVPVTKASEHYFFKLSDYKQRLRDLMARGYTQKTVANKLREWFEAGLKDWDITRDAPYFGFPIPGENNKYFYVWLDAPIGYMASVKNHCDSKGLDFEVFWPGLKGHPGEGQYELYHFIGKDIMYFHALFWPAMLMGAGFKTADRLFVHGFLTVNGEKMSKSRGTFIRAATYLKHLGPEYLRYYYASKLSGGIEDIDLRTEDFLGRANSELVGKFANLASRCGPMLNKHFDGRLGRLDEGGLALVRQLKAQAGPVAESFESLDYAGAVRRINAAADGTNRYLETNKPWVTAKSDPDRARAALTAGLNAVRILTIYLKPVLPKYAAAVEQFLEIGPLDYAGLDTVIENRRIGSFRRLFERLDKKQVDAMIEESKELEASPRLQEESPG
jgi:methionyl-tRNA synthetase